MFTGLIEDVGKLAGRAGSGNAGKLLIETALPLNEIHCGDSLSVNGACLTVEEIQPARRRLVFHTLAETLARTNLGRLATGRAVNLERAMCLGDRLGGHLVSGHIDTVAEVLGSREVGADRVLTVALPESLRQLLIPKGSITVDGVSLTVASLAVDTFSVHLIPLTWSATNLHEIHAGDLVNLEADLIGKYIQRQLEIRQGGKLSMTDLENAGFLT